MHNLKHIRVEFCLLLAFLGVGCNGAFDLRGTPESDVSVTEESLSAPPGAVQTVTSATPAQPVLDATEVAARQEAAKDPDALTSDALKNYKAARAMAQRTAMATEQALLGDLEQAKPESKPGNRSSDGNPVPDLARAQSDRADLQASIAQRQAEIVERER